MFGFRKRHNESSYRIFSKAFKYFQRTSSHENNEDLNEDQIFFADLSLFVFMAGEQLISNWHEFMHDEKTLTYCITNAYEDAGYSGQDFAFHWNQMSPIIKSALQR